MLGLSLEILIQLSLMQHRQGLLKKKKKVTGGINVQPWLKNNGLTERVNPRRNAVKRARLGLDKEISSKLT